MQHQNPKKVLWGFLSTLCVLSFIGIYTVSSGMLWEEIEEADEQLQLEQQTKKNHVVFKNPLSIDHADGQIVDQYEALPATSDPTSTPRSRIYKRRQQRKAAATASSSSSSSSSLSSSVSPSKSSSSSKKVSSSSSSSSSLLSPSSSSAKDGQDTQGIGQDVANLRKEVEEEEAQRQDEEDDEEEEDGKPSSSNNSKAKPVIIPKFEDSILPEVASPSKICTKILRIACVGDSITHGNQFKGAGNYPSILGNMLNAGNITWTNDNEKDITCPEVRFEFEVKNFGLGGSTALRELPEKEHKYQSYWSSLQFESAKDYKAHFIIVLFGTNDSKYRSKLDNFADDFQELINELKKSMSLPVVPFDRIIPHHLEEKPLIIMYPPPVVRKQWKANEKIIKTKIIPDLVRVSNKLQMPEINLHPVLSNSKACPKISCFGPDGLHFNKAGNTQIAIEVFRALVLNFHSHSIKVETPYQGNH